jgi:excisionase family DNA binding protein
MFLGGEMRRLLLTKEAAEVLRVSEEYLRSLIRKKKISAYKEGRRGGYRISSEEIENYINRRFSSSKSINNKYSL